MPDLVLIASLFVKAHAVLNPAHAVFLRACCVVTGLRRAAPQRR